MSRGVENGSAASATGLVTIDAVVDATERPGLIAAGARLSECLGQAAGQRAWPVRLQFHASVAESLARPAPSAIIISLLPEAHRLDERIVETEARWRANLIRSRASGAPAFVRTIFRHVRDRPREGQASPLLERIRRLNHIAVGLSHELGVAVIDVDRAFAHIGARWLDTDYRLLGARAAEVSAHVTVWSLLSFGLDHVVDPDTQERAKAILGNFQEIELIVNRRLSRQSATQVASKSGFRE